MKNRLKEIDAEIESCEDHSAEYDFGGEKTSIEEVLEKLENGINYEIQCLQRGTAEFFNQKLHEDFLKDQKQYHEDWLIKINEIKLSESLYSF